MTRDQEKTNGQNALPAATELTPIGEQYIIPGCEKRETRNKKEPQQPNLWDQQ